MLKLDSIYYGDSATLVIPLTWEGAAFSPGVDYSLIWTAKEKLSDLDPAAKIQKTDEAGITVTGSNASIELVREDTVDLTARQLVWDVVATHIVTGERHTVAVGTLPLLRGSTRLAEVSVPIHTTNPPAATALSANVIALADTDEEPQDADQFGYNRPGITNALKKITGAGIKAWLKNYFDTIYQAIGGGGGGAHAPTHAIGGDDPLTPADIGAIAEGDSRLSDARPAIDVYDWAKEASKPSYSAGEVGAIPESDRVYLATAEQGALADSALQFETPLAYEIFTATYKGTPEDGDRIGFQNNSVGSTATVYCFLNDLWTYTAVKDQEAWNYERTIAGAKTWSGQQEATNQAATNGTSMMTRGLVDDRHILTSTYVWLNTTAGSNVGALHSGGGAVVYASDTVEMDTSAAAGGVCGLRYNTQGYRAWHKPSGTGRNIVNWSRRTIHKMKVMTWSLAGTTTVFRELLGVANAHGAATDLGSSNKAIGIKIINKVVWVQVANGSAVNTVSTGVTLTDVYDYEIVIDAKGDGTWDCWINDSKVLAAQTGAPTGNGAGQENSRIVSITNGSTAASRIMILIAATTIQI